MNWRSGFLWVERLELQCNDRVPFAYEFFNAEAQSCRVRREFF